MHRLVVLVTTMVALWLALSGHYTGLLLSFGVLSVALVTWITIRMAAPEGGVSAPSLNALRLFPYLVWLVKEIVVANIQVAKIIVDPRLPISPTTIRVRSSQRTLTGQVLYANSITLTPGTVTINLLWKEITVHALTKDGALGLASGDMDARCSAVERPR
ncbi:MAG: Na+/H+ antiporter subunit E [Pseudomonadota bacterium]